MIEQYNVEMNGGEAEIKVSGNLDSEQSGDQLDATIKGLLESGKNTIVVDLSEVKIINSYGLGRLVKHHNQLKSNSGVLTIKTPDNFVRYVIQTLRLNELFCQDNEDS